MTAALRHPPVRDLCSPDYELSHHTHRETLPDYDLGLLLDDKAAAIVRANRLKHDREDVPDDTQRIEGIGTIFWMLICGMATVAMVAWLAAGAADSGPFCPGADPSWLGHCADAPMIEGVR